MKDNNEPLPSEPSSLHNPFAWKVGNWFTTTLATSTTLTLFLTPVQRAIMRTVEGKYHQIFTKDFFKTAYTGVGLTWQANLIKSGFGTLVRTSAHEIEDQTTHSSSLLVTTAICGITETVITQIPDTRAALSRLATPPIFKNTPYNIWALARLTFPLRLTSGFAAYSTFLLFEPLIAARLPQQDSQIKHFIGGAAAGMLTSTFTIPLTGCIDYRITQVKVVNDGSLYIQKVPDSIREFMKKFQADPQQTLKELYPNLHKQLCLRMLRAGMTFGLISWLFNQLGTKPLEDLVNHNTAFPGNNAHSLFNHNPRLNQELEDELTEVWEHNLRNFL